MVGLLVFLVVYFRALSFWSDVNCSSSKQSDFGQAAFKSVLGTAPWQPKHRTRSSNDHAPLQRTNWQLSSSERKPSPTLLAQQLPSAIRKSWCVARAAAPALLRSVPPCAWKDPSLAFASRAEKNCAATMLRQIHGWILPRFALWESAPWLLHRSKTKVR